MSILDRLRALRQALDEDRIPEFAIPDLDDCIAELEGQASRPEGEGYVMSRDYEALWETLKVRDVIVCLNILKTESWQRANATTLGTPRGQEACFEEWEAVNLEWIAPQPQGEKAILPVFNEEPVAWHYSAEGGPSEGIVSTIPPTNNYWSGWKSVPLYANTKAIKW